jgi:hypothetical protein
MMKNRHLFLTLILTGLALLAGIHGLSAQAAPAQQIGTPTTQWEYGGCYSSWCETSWYSSPAVADLDDDGNSKIAKSLVLNHIPGGNIK